jgi:hypothetical protein
LTFADQTAIYPESALLRDFHADNFNRWRFIQIMGHEPFRVSDTVLIAKALAFFSVPAKTLIVAERQTTLYLALLRQSEASGAETEWVLYDGNEEHGIFVSRIVRALRPCDWERIIFCVPVNRFHDFESLIDIAAASANERGRIWYYDENLFFIDSVDVVLADGIFADRPNRCPLTLFFRKRLRDRLYALGFDLSFERYRPSLDDGGHELLNRLCAVFPDLRDAVMNNAATKLYFCVAAKRDGPKGENTV